MINSLNKNYDKSIDTIQTMEKVKKSIDKAGAIHSYVQHCVHDLPPTYSLEQYGFRQVVANPVTKKEIETKFKLCDVAKERLDKFEDVKIHKDKPEHSGDKKEHNITVVPEGNKSNYKVKTRVPMF